LITEKSLCSASIFLGVAVGCVLHLNASAFGAFTDHPTLSNIVGPFLFKDSEAPKYPTGIIGCMVSRILEVRFRILVLFAITDTSERGLNLR
jgi:hypothetical protein